MKKISLHIQNISIGYPAKKQEIVVATAISVQVETPKFIALLGKNGIGKSTLLRSIANMQPILKGKISVANVSLNKISPSDLAKKISVVLTERIPPSNLTVYELIALGRQVYTNWIGTLTDEDKLQINKAIKQTNSTALLHKKIDELSDGQYQKVMIARALAQDTAIILLDEPTAHLDINNKVTLFTLLKKLSKNKLIIISTHELQLAIQTADDLWLMRTNIFESGTTKTLINNNRVGELFMSDLFFFDKKTKQFIFR